ncbi:Predicted PurR-regulated permease PerM [Rhizobiales bacterium GAS191]|nr:Predicted PurR-regulated permease PerM [Rhizobiales bacterium GAS191]
MRVSQAAAFWIAVFAGVLAALVVLREVLLPFVAGMALAYVLDPFVDRLERIGLSRLAAALAIICVYLAGFFVLIVFVVPILVGELASFFGDIPSYIARVQAVMVNPNRPWLSKIVGEGLSNAEKSTGQLATLSAGWLTASLRSLWSGGRALLSIFSVLVVTPIVAFYLICDWKKMVAAIDRWIPSAHRETVRMLARQIDDTVSGFIRGQGMICLILASFYAAALTLFELRHGLIIGLASGFVSFIPYLGSLTGLTLSMCVAIAQFGPHGRVILTVAAIFLIGQSFGDYVLSPYFVGRRVNLNPVWLMFALFAFGYLFGFVGLLIAVPLAAAIGVLMRFMITQYLESSLYGGGRPVVMSDDGASSTPKQ